MVKEEYVTAQIELTVFENEDIIVTSGGNDTPVQGGGSDA